ncbi:hypothetical protein E7T09_15775 [Deinococcus sp. KSM4-11]|uniref:M14 family zinc carboxypeptidase n=1 Tax=Deinococcus sp. KSM4-11 TaxID=2568654 RepID=UPI0010A31E6C|nr:M14 family zinc carboxypeptidase [Deinococcus sp. KSM4-11]THF85427.1 hypothetical protein E7T09_15775 [Deinococcus sp. KSM4-11]
MTDQSITPEILDRWLRTVPDYTRFLTVDELYAQARAVARDHPDLAVLREVGHSTDGEAIPMVSIGDGPVPLLFYACPHPNEPVGAMLVSYLLDELIRSPELRSGFTWHLLPCVDPDGTRLNEGWFAGPFTARHYAQEFYRPPGVEQVEWTFPVAYKDFHFDAPIPETRALMDALTAVRPAFIYSLHNAGFGGVYYYISRDVPQVYPEFYRVPESLGLFLAKGEAEMPWGVEFAPAIYKTSSIAEAYDYYETYTTEAPASMIGSGGSSGDFLEAMDGQRALTLITELPYFQAAAVADETLSGQTRREVLLEGQDKTWALTQAVDALYAPVAGLMTLDSRLHRAFLLFHQHYLKAGVQRQAILADPATQEGASMAQRTDALYVSPFYQLLIYSMLRRAFQAQRARTDDPALAAAQEHLNRLLDQGFTDLETHLEYQAIPIRKAVQTQLGALLALLPHLRGSV